jgi:hypothetical protein
LLDQVLVTAQPPNPEQQVTLGADTQYQDEKFIEALRQRAIAPHVSEYVKGNLGKNSLQEAERADPRRSISQRKRKLIERVFGWAKFRPAASPGEATRTQARGLVLPLGHYRL